MEKVITKFFCLLHDNNYPIFLNLTKLVSKKSNEFCRIVSVEFWKQVDKHQEICKAMTSFWVIFDLLNSTFLQNIKLINFFCLRSYIPTFCCWSVADCHPINKIIDQEDTQSEIIWSEYNQRSRHADIQRHNCS